MFTCGIRMKSSIEGYYFKFSTFEVFFNSDDALEKELQYIR